MSSGPWRYAAAIDKSGRIVSRRFYGIWSKPEIFDVTTLAALLNSPIVEAFTSLSLFIFLDNIYGKKYNFRNSGNILPTKHAKRNEWNLAILV